MDGPDQQIHKKKKKKKAQQQQQQWHMAIQKKTKERQNANEQEGNTVLAFEGHQMFILTCCFKWQLQENN